MKVTRYVRLFNAMVALCAAIVSQAAPPTIRWDANLYSPFPQTSSGWFQAVRAIGSDTDGNLVGVRVDYLDPANGWTPFAWNGGGDGFQNQSDANFAFSSGPAQTFRAKAVDSAGGESPFIYLLVKANGSSFTVDDLPIEVGSGHRFVPNAGNIQINSRILAQVIQSLSGRNGITIWFKDGVYDYDTSFGRSSITTVDDPETTFNEAFTWQQVNSSADEAAKVEVINASANQYIYNPGTLGSISGAANITFRAETTRGTVLMWASYSSKGATFPTAQELITNSVMNKNLYTNSADPRPWPLPGPFVVVESSSVNITFEGLVFDTPYARKTTNSRADQGRHLQVKAPNTTVNNCGFGGSPGWSVAAENASDFHINASIFYDGSGDGINLTNCTGAYIVGNSLYDLGDDAIILWGQNNYALYNRIERSGWRGILVHSSSNSKVAYNTVVSSAGNGIEVSPPEVGMSQTVNLAIHDNTLGGVGSIAREGVFYSSRDVILLGWTSGVGISNNTISRYRGTEPGSYPTRSGVRIQPSTTGQTLTNNNFIDFSGNEVTFGN